ncbi:MAG: glutaredoxin family protein [Candidatus Spechtbacteria bacterium]|nr:glutaredoxin family protein [Candidatus Spechtbacteria bacterium]
MHQVTIYSTPSCVYCKMAKDYFKEHNISYSERNVADDDEARRAMVQKSNQLGVPVIDIDGTIIVGFNKIKLAELLEIK